MIGALLCRNNCVEIPFPGGCKVGNRGIDLHIEMLEKLGVKCIYKEKGILLFCSKLVGTMIELPYPSRGVTGNLILASLGADGITIINNANTSPEIIELEKVLISMGAEIYGVGTSFLKIKGKKNISKNCDEIVIPSDKIEIGTYVIAALITKGEITINNVDVKSIDDFLAIISMMGGKVEYDLFTKKLYVKYENELNSIDVFSGLPPKLDPDFEPLLAALLSVCRGKGIIEDKINPGRHRNFLKEFEKVGINVEYIDDNKAIVYGETTLKKIVHLLDKICGVQ